MASKFCDSCKSSAAALFCRPDSAFLCINCDSKIHAANKLASRHIRVCLCEVCEQAPAHVTCKADAASLCVTCDRDIHSANPLSSRHERVPVTPFYDSVSSAPLKPNGAVNFLDGRDFSEIDCDAAWLLPNLNQKMEEIPDVNTGQYFFADEIDPYLDLDFEPVDPKIEAQDQDYYNSGTDGVVPEKTTSCVQAPMVKDYCFDLNFSGTKHLTFGYPAQCLSHSVSSSSSMDVGVVPDGSAMTDVSNPYEKGTEPTVVAVQLSWEDREARVLRYREKRKNRKFEKTIRYASRKAYAEMRPRIKGRFAKRADIEADADHGSIYGFGLVPSF